MIEADIEGLLDIIFKIEGNNYDKIEKELEIYFENYRDTILIYREPLYKYFGKNKISISSLNNIYNFFKKMLTKSRNIFIIKISIIILNSLNLEYIHISNSAGITNFHNDIIGNLVRLGIGMYSFTGNKKTPYLKNIFTIKSRVLFIKKVKKDSFVSYGRHYTLPADSTYAVLPIGYADGLKKYLSKGGYVLINNHRCEIIGNICMDMTMIRIPKEIENSIKIGDEVTVINADILDNLNIPELCVWEFMTGIGKRVKKIIV